MAEPVAPVAAVDDVSLRAQLEATRSALAHAVAEMERLREASASTRQLVDVLRDVAGELPVVEIYHVLTRRLADALQVKHCMLVLARTGDRTGTVAASLDASAAGSEICLEQSPEITEALETRRPVFIVPRAIALPFAIDSAHGGVLHIRCTPDERPLTAADVEFAEFVMRATEVAIRRAYALEAAHADNLRLEALATTDPLTRVLNRRALVDRLSTEMDRARRFGSTLTLLLIDVDTFKAVNDAAGHLAGDAGLRQLAALLEDAVRRVDIVSRFGGDEFIIILPETSTDGAFVFAERLRDRVAAHPFDLGHDRHLHLTISIGIASFPLPQVASTDDLFARADEALYRAKSGGRNRVCR